MAPNGKDQSLFSNKMSDLDMAFDGHLFSQLKASTVKKRTPYKRGKTKKPKGMPIKNLSAYNLFFKEQRAIIVEERTVALGQFTARGRRVKAKIPFEELARIIGTRWKGIDPMEMKRFQRLADEDKIRFEREMKVYLSSAEQVTTKPKNQERPASTPLPLSSFESNGQGIEHLTIRSNKSCPSFQEPFSLRPDYSSWTAGARLTTQSIDTTTSESSENLVQNKPPQPDGECISFSGNGNGLPSSAPVTNLSEHMLHPTVLSHVDRGCEEQSFDSRHFFNGRQHFVKNLPENQSFSENYQPSPGLIPSLPNILSFEEGGQGGYKSNLTSSMQSAMATLSESAPSTSSTSLFDIFDQLGYGEEDLHEGFPIEPSPLYYGCT